ncbi:hypothetical protein [uncultured Campylobacter sp.]|uniref:hypothetical protein n=1 Tax=uncultured Campylobacter sp. TaxID=218934 RepID=UPI00262DED42|nr:hypothetical protein [uncultured Campylobacter sp.]
MSDWIEILLGCIGLIWLCVWANKPYKMSDSEIEEWNRNAAIEGSPLRIETKREEQERLRRQKEEEEEKRRKELRNQEELRVKELNERIDKIKNSREYIDQTLREKRINEMRARVQELSNQLIYSRSEYLEEELKKAVEKLETLEKAEKTFTKIILPTY